jgi:hypothetical protein
MSYLYSNGMYHSGSTFVFNLLKFYNNIYSLKFTEVKKNHEDWLDLVTDKDLSVYTFRDVRNCCASMMRRDGMDEKNFLHARYYSPETFILSLISQDEKMRKNEAKTLILKYEEDIMKIEMAVSKIADFLNIKLSSGDIKEYSNIFNINKIKKFVDSVRIHSNSSSHQYWPNHIGDGNTQYEDFFSLDKFSEKSMGAINEWLNKNNYIL